MVLVGNEIYSTVLVHCKETPKTWAVQRNARHSDVFLKSKYRGVLVGNEAEGKALSERIDQERKVDIQARDAYWQMLKEWNAANPKPKPRSGQEILDALGLGAQGEEKKE